MSFTSLKGNCLICDGQRKDCRQSDDSGLVFCRGDLNQVPHGWRYIKDDCNGFGIFAPDDGDGGYTPLPKRAKSKPKPTVAPLATTERDRQYRSIAERCGLLSVHRADLRRRGLTDSQVDLLLQRGLIWSWDSGYSPGVSANLPGADGADHLRNFSGLAIAVPTATGEIQGAQIRPRQGSYFWVSSEKIGGAASNLPSGKLPIGVYFPAGDSDASIVNLAEGFLKPAIAALTHDQIFIGAAGGNFASSQIETLAAIQALGAHTVVLNADGGAVGNRNVMRAYARLQDSLSAAGISLMVRWWGQVTKQDGDVDEISPEQFQAARLIDWPEFEAIARRRGGVGKQKIFARIISQIRKAIPERRRRGQKPQQQIDCEYQASDRHSTWRQAQAAGYQYVLDISGTGGGKSFSAGQVEPRDFEGIKQVWYLSGQHRNVTVPTLQNWPDLEARHNGLVYENNPDGSRRYRRRRSGETWDTEANCNRTKIVSALRAKNISGADTANLVCGPCPLREACAHSEGVGYGFLKQRYEALQEHRLRAHPDSTPSPAEYDYASVAAIWDEPGVNLKTADPVIVTQRDIDQLTSHFARHDPALLGEFLPLLDTLSSAIGGETKPPDRYGWNKPQLLELVGELPTVAFDELKAAMQPNLSFLNPAAAYGEDMADLPPSVRRKFAEKDAAIADTAEEQIAKQWLPAFLAIATGEQIGWLNLNNAKLTITQPQSRHRELAEAIGFNIFLDATLSRDRLAKMLACDPSEIYVCRQHQATVENLKINQVNDMGRLGLQRGGDLAKRVAAIVSHYQDIDPSTKVIDFKKNGADGAWWVDSRGVNTLKDAKTLILVGTPTQNIAALQATFTCETGLDPLEHADQFQTYVDDLTEAEMVQGIGRLRAHLRPDEDLQVVVLCNFDLSQSGYQVKEVKAADITPHAGDRFERTKAAMVEIVGKMMASGEKVTQAAVAKFLGITQGALSKNLRYRELLHSLLDGSYCKSNNPAIADMASVAEEALTGSDTPEAVAATIREVFFDWLAPPDWGDVISRLSIEAKSRAIAVLSIALGHGDELKSLVST